jgi:hypothetical protein
LNFFCFFCVGNVKVKNIKKIYKILIISFLVITVLLSAGYLTLRNTKTQTWLVSIIAKEVSENLNASFTLESVRLLFSEKVIFRNLLIKDQQKDTLLFATEIIANIKSIKRKARKVVIDKLNINNSQINFTTDSSNILNIKFITDELRRKDTTKTRWNIQVRNIELKNSDFCFNPFLYKSKETGINFSDLQFSDLNAYLSDFSIQNGIVDFFIEELTFRDKSSFQIDRLKSKAQICKNHFSFSDLEILTPLSQLKAENLKLSFKNYPDLREFVDKVTINIKIPFSDVNLSDVNYFVPFFEGLDQNLALSGNFSGKISDFKGKQVNLQFGDFSKISGNFSFIGLPNIEETFIFINMQELITSIEDIEKFDNPKTGGKIILPEGFKELGLITYKGNFAGFIDDFVAYGQFTSDLGNISTDLLIKPDTAASFNFSGKLKTKDFKIGKLTKTEKLFGKITLNATLDGYTFRGKQFSASLDGNIQDLEFNDYHYRGIELSGAFTEKAYDGSIYIEDPNVKFNFLGRLDFSREIPEFDFTASVPRADLFKLNFDKYDSTSFLSFILTANFVGNNLDNLNGDIKLLNSYFKRRDEELDVYDFTLTANNQNDTSKITLRTDFVDGELKGNYEFALLPVSFKYLIRNFLPSAFRGQIDTTGIAKNNFVFDIRLKNTSKLMHFFLPSCTLSDDVHLFGKYSPVQNNIYLRSEGELFGFRKKNLNRFTLTAESVNNIFTTSLQSEKFTINDRINLENLNLFSIVKDDSVNLRINWQNKDTLRTSGDFLASAKLLPKPELNKPALEIKIKPTKIFVKNSAWAINESLIKIDTTTINIFNFSINKKNQQFYLYGTISGKSEDTLKTEFRNLNLATLNIFSGEKLEISGLLNGNASLTKLYSNPLFQSDIQIEEFTVNNESFGNTRILSKWDALNNALHIHTNSFRGNIETIDLEGDYKPEDKSMLFNLTLDKMRLNMFDPFMGNFASDLVGIATGKLIISGTSDAPLINGNIKLQKTSFLINYLQTQYNFSEIIRIKDNIILFENVKLFDPSGNVAITNGSITHDNFRNFNFNIKLETKNFLFLATSQEDDRQFYGDGYATGIVNINGPPKNIMLDISAKTEKNTRLFIPLNAEGDISEYKFVTFKGSSAETENIQIENQYEVDLTGLSMNFNLEVTPDVEIQIIFDSKIGDIMKGRSEGNLNLQINPQGEFKIYGTLRIEEGDYLFTLRNIINKKFEIRKGGTITWDGNPSDASIDINAIYNLKTSLSTLFSDETYNKRIPVECQLILSEKLMNPNINFDIFLPTADEETKTNLKNSIDTEEKLSKQFLSLLIINSFLPDPNLTPQTTQQSVPGYSPAAGITTSELLSSQLNHWLSQISNDFDVGFYYRPGDEVTSNEVEVALSTQLLNNRVTINGNVDVGGSQTTQTSTSNIAGDFDVDVKINQSGKLRVKAFTRANDKLIYEWAPYTQGIGLFYREEFNNFPELMHKYWNQLFTKKKVK